MSNNIPTQGNSILVDTPESVGDTISAPIADESQALTSWVMDRVNRWEQHRDQGYGRKFREYWRLWRGVWAQEDSNRQSERSRIVAPALSQAIEQTVSEHEEAIFGREVWFDVLDGIADQDKHDAIAARDQLLEDFEYVNAKGALTEAIQVGAIFGTGAVKLSTEVMQTTRPERDPATQQLSVAGEDRVYVVVSSIRPDHLIPDPAGTTVSEMMGIAERQMRPLHGILERVERGTYLRSALPRLFPANRPSNYDADAGTDAQSDSAATDADSVDVVEYHGKVPLELLNALTPAKSDVDDILKLDGGSRPRYGDGPLIEAIVTIANGSVLLRAIPNPFVMKDRSIIAFPFEKVPGRFWGRGIAEKGYNPQKALDAEIRARIDALGFVSAPMLGVDSGRIPRGFRYEVKPGKIWTTQGNPDEILRPVAIGQINPATFNQASEMERMVQMGTGSFDTATSLKSQSQSGANGVSANSMLMGAFVKRAKRSISQVTRELLVPTITKSLWRYMQFAPQRYPRDYEFQVKTGLGLVAREVEAAQMTQLIGMMPEEFAAVRLTLVQGIIEHSALPNKAIIMQQIEQALAPPPEEEQQRVKELQDMQFQAALAEAEGALLRNQKTMAEIRKILAESEAVVRKGDQEDDKLIQEQQRLQLVGQELDQFAQQNRIAQERLEVQREALDVRRQQVNKSPAKS